MTNQEILNDFAAHLAEDGKWPATIDSCVGDASAFLVYLEEKGETFGGDFKQRYVSVYRSHFLENGYEATTINKKINSLQAIPSGSSTRDRVRGPLAASGGSRSTLRSRSSVCSI